MEAKRLMKVSTSSFERGVLLKWIFSMAATRYLVSAFMVSVVFRDISVLRPRLVGKKLRESGCRGGLGWLISGF